MSFDRVLNEYRRRAGLPESEGTGSSKSAHKGSVKPQDAMIASRSQIYRIHRVLELIESKASQGALQAASKDDRDLFSAIAGMVRGQALKEASHPISEFDTPLYLEDDDSLGMAEPTEIEVRVEYTVEPTEYEGPFVSYQGGVRIESIRVLKPFEFMGRRFSAGEPFPEALLRYLVDPSGRTILTSGGRDPWGDLEVYVAELIHQHGDVAIPQHDLSRSGGR